MTHLQVNCTFHRHAAIATSFVRLDQMINNTISDFVHMNTLVKRWNQLGSQGNLMLLQVSVITSIQKQNLNLCLWATNRLRNTTYLHCLARFICLWYQFHIPYGVRYRLVRLPYCRLWWITKFGLSHRSIICRIWVSNLDSHRCSVCFIEPYCGKWAKT